MTEHTPGPWNWRKPDHSKDSCRVPRGDLGGIWSDGRAVITCGFEGDYYPCCGVDPSDADARLIAAAPDLLAACESALDQLGAMARDYDTNPWCRELQAAIAKARGE